MFRIAIVGAGGVGKAHANVISVNPDCTLVAVCDLIEERADEIATKFDAQSFTDYKEMCAQVQMDAVILNLPHFLHCEVSVYFMEHGINVLVEKPMAMNVEECDIMIEAAERNNVKLAVGHVQKYYSAYRDIRKIIEDGSLGKLCMMTETRNVDYVTNRPAWFLKKSLSGGGIVMNYGAHSFDKFFYTTGLDVKAVHSVISNPVSDDDVEVNAQIFAEFEGGVTAQITYCGCHVPWEYTISFYFTDGVAKVIDGWKLQILTKDNEIVEVDSSTDIFDRQIAEFAKLLKGEENEMVTPEYGRKVIEVLEKII